MLAYLLTPLGQALGLSGLIAFYGLWARFWPNWFNAGVIAHAHPVEDGYQLGRAIFWRMPARWVFGLAGLLGGVWAAALWLPAGLLPAALLITGLWWVYPPGRRLGLFPVTLAGGGFAVEQRAGGGVWRTLGVFLGMGVLPALALSAGVWLSLGGRP